VATQQDLILASPRFAADAADHEREDDRPRHRRHGEKHGANPQLLCQFNMADLE
jgi:hypothetical protein